MSKRACFPLHRRDAGGRGRPSGARRSALDAEAAAGPDRPPGGRHRQVQRRDRRGEGPARYYSERADREIDFVLQLGSEVAPVEVKAGRDRKGATFKSYVRDRRPAFAVRFSRMNLRKDGGFVNVPLYLAPRFERCLGAPATPSPASEPHAESAEFAESESHAESAENAEPESRAEGAE